MNLINFFYQGKAVITLFRTKINFSPEFKVKLVLEVLKGEKELK